MLSNLFVVRNPEKFFYDLVSSAVNNQKLDVSEGVKAYLIRLLSDNARGKDLIDRGDTPLSIIFQRSMREPIRERRLMLKYVGDHSLYIAGFFNESLNRKIIDTNYYVSIGGQAFGNLSSISGSYELSSIYAEMFGRFNQLVDVIMEVSFDTSMTKAEDILRLYDRWLHTGSPVLERKLVERGIITSDKKIKAA